MNDLITEPNKAYIAGIIDGEGSISIVSNNTKGKKGLYPSTYIKISVGSSSKDLIDFLVKLLGGCSYKEKNKQNRKRFWRWSLSSNQAANFIQIIVPYLIIKKHQANLAIEFYKVHKYALHLNPKLTQPYRIKELEFKEQMRTLNRNQYGTDGYEVDKL